MYEFVILVRKVFGMVYRPKHGENNYVCVDIDTRIYAVD
jgi:hypothetical protein